MSPVYKQLLKTGVDAARYKVNKEYASMKGDVIFKPGTAVPRSSAKNILILSTWRSGSTFLGDIFNAYPGTFYSFEPLHPIISSSRVQCGALKARVLSQLTDILNCSMPASNSFMEYVRKKEFLLEHNTRYWEACSINRDICYDVSFFNKICSVMPVNVIKTVRLGAEPVRELLEDRTQDLRVIQLVRDPRGTLNSRRRLSWCDSPICRDPEVFCLDLLHDLRHGNSLQREFPDRFLTIRYEDLGMRTEDMVEMMMEFVGLHVPRSVRTFLRKHTQEAPPAREGIKEGSPPRGATRKKTRKKPDPYSTFRNSASTTFAWRDQLSFEEVEKIQALCSDPLKLLNYRIFQNREQYMNKSLSILLSDDTVADDVVSYAGGKP